MLLTEKKSCSKKGRLAYNGKRTRDWISKTDKSSPTVHTESLMITCTIDAQEERDAMSLDVPNAFIQTSIPKKPKGERIIMKVRGQFVDWLCELDPFRYSPFVVYERGVKTLYLVCKKAIYGMLEAGLMWYRKFRTNLGSIGFKLNPYDECVANRNVRGKQHTIRFHVDDVLSSHVDKKLMMILGNGLKRLTVS